MKPQLSPRQLEILRLLSEGLIQKEVAVRLNLSEDTIVHQLDAIRKKCGGGNIVTLLRHFYTFVPKGEQ
jgi:DNA-binding CsgD family transcriptional regulator